MHPRSPIRYYRIAEAIKAINPVLGSDPDSISWTAVINDRFVIADCFILDTEAEGSHPVHLYIHNRDGLTLSERFELFESIMDIQTLNMIRQAYDETRETELPLELPEGVDDAEKKGSSSGSSESTTNGSKPQNGVTKSVTRSKPTKAKL